MAGLQLISPCACPQPPPVVIGPTETPCQIDLLSLIPEKFRGSALVQQYLEAVQEIVCQWRVQIDTLADLVNPDNVPFALPHGWLNPTAAPDTLDNLDPTNQLAVMLALNLGYQLQYSNASTETNLRRQLVLIVDWYRRRGVYGGINALLYSLGWSGSAVDLWVKNHSANYNDAGNVADSESYMEAPTGPDTVPGPNDIFCPCLCGPTPTDPVPSAASCDGCGSSGDLGGGQLVAKPNAAIAPANPPFPFVAPWFFASGSSAVPVVNGTTLTGYVKSPHFKLAIDLIKCYPSGSRTVLLDASLWPPVVQLVESMRPVQTVVRYAARLYIVADVCCSLVESLCQVQAVGFSDCLPVAQLVFNKPLPGDSAVWSLNSGKFLNEVPQACAEKIILWELGTGNKGVVPVCDTFSIESPATDLPSGHLVNQDLVELGLATFGVSVFSDYVDFLIVLSPLVLSLGLSEFRLSAPASDGTQFVDATFPDIDKTEDASLEIHVRVKWPCGEVLMDPPVPESPCCQPLPSPQLVLS